jgi:hypothetical protein
MGSFGAPERKRGLMNQDELNDFVPPYGIMSVEGRR